MPMRTHTYINFDPVCLLFNTLIEVAIRIAFNIAHVYTYRTNWHFTPFKNQALCMYTAKLNHALSINCYSIISLVNEGKSHDKRFIT